MNLRNLKKYLQKDLRKTQNRKTIGCLVFIIFTIVSIFLWQNYRPVHLLEQGISFEQKKQFEQALSSYNKLLETALSDEEKPTALYRSARIYQYEQKNYQLALFFYLRLQKNYPHSKYIDKARKESAYLLKFQQQNCQQAIPFYQRLIEETSPFADSYQYEIADCYVRLKNWTQAAIEFETLITSYKQTELLPLAYYRYANNLLLNQERETARTIFEKLKTQYPENNLAHKAAFRLAEMLEEEGKNKAALEAYTGLNKEKKSERITLKINQLKNRINEKKRIE